MPRLKGNTKEIILEKALMLFSQKGFESVSIRDIAAEVGIGNSALYKHFESKQAIFDSLVEKLKKEYLESSSIVSEDIRGIDAVKEACLKMFKYQTGDENIVRFRQLLLIEKFRNPEMAEIYREFFVNIPLRRLTSIFDTLQGKGLMEEGDIFVYAMELYAPFYLFHFVEYDRDIMDKLMIHVENFSGSFRMK
ncbi:MAG: TetR/AcrR family transcriptional regulator [Lachnospiraceae bacterium]|nr:TetR/AcrR family transcriptional regulator [Lachnospiraceae bacterium]